MSTSIVNSHDNDKNSVSWRILLDYASQSNFVSMVMVKKLNLTMSKIDFPVIRIIHIAYWIQK